MQRCHLLVEFELCHKFYPSTQGVRKMASYIQSVLGNNERLVYTAKVSLWSMVPLFVLGFVLLFFWGLGLLVWLSAFIKYKTTELGITDKKIIAKFGFIRRDTIELLLPKVES